MNKIEFILTAIWLVVAAAILIYTTRQWLKEKDEDDKSEPPNLFMMALFWPALLVFGLIFIVWIEFFEPNGESE